MNAVWRKAVENVFRMSSHTERQLIDHIVGQIAANTGGFIVTLNASILRAATRQHSDDLLPHASIVTCDSRPLQLLSYLLQDRVPPCVTGASLIYGLAQAAGENSLKVCIIGGSPGAADKAAQVFTSQYPGYINSGTVCPPFGFERDPQYCAQLLDQITQTRPDLIFVGLGYPKQERLSSILQTASPNSWMLNCGAAVNFAAGTQQRAPRWMQRTGLEWAHRLLNEPTRLAPRYSADFGFLVWMLLQTGRAKLQSALHERSVRP